ncbi:M56 family metallopeptidase [Natronosporangium hydrolyticum]|uniref:M56 family metallopeptidase n=1 Tax=Natronosporangium hydrolyticum TaxID=2811111 RepID=A0A895YMY2_9ACTN|nr:M56 family metallopeptidase [Natronosporangium hydrolyticum]QSB16046.1 M56 family metallopeptidase [Natronosporangium hydrolyticum]
MTYVVGHATVLIACAVGIVGLARSQWVWRTPRVGIASWQALGLALGLALIGLPLAAGLAPYGAPLGPALAQFGTELGQGQLPAGLGSFHLLAILTGALVAARLCWVTVTYLLHTLRAQRRHRELLALVGRADPAAPGATVLDHPSAAAYCLPGLRPTVVVSAGTLHLLRGSELAAVLSHERSHAAERHDLVLLPFTALRRALPLDRWLRAAYDAVALLVEMRADDRARQHHPDGLVAALRRFAAAPSVGAPAGALGVGDRAVEVRVRRLHDRRRRPWLRGAVTFAGAFTLAVAPVGLALLGG